MFPSMSIRHVFFSGIHVTVQPSASCYRHLWTELLYIYQNKVWSNLPDAVVWYGNHGIIRNHRPESLAAWHNNFADASLALVNLQVTDVPKSSAILNTNYFFFP